MASIQSWCHQLGARLRAADGHGAAHLLRHLAQPTEQRILVQQYPSTNTDSNSAYQLQSLTSNAVPDPYNTIIYHYLLSLTTGPSSNNDSENESFEQLYQSCDKLYSAMELERESNWSLPVINELLTQLRLSAYRAAATASVVQVQDLLKRYLQKMVVDRSPLPVSKKYGCIFIINHLFKIYFKLNNLKMCTYLIKIIKNLPNIATYPISHQVTYHYYYGRLLLYEENYQEAKNAFLFAFENCPRDEVSNQRKILGYLLPLSLLASQYPKRRLLAQYQLEGEFLPLIQSLRYGDLRLFTSHLARYQHVFIQKGIFLLIEKLKIQLYRNLFQMLYEKIYLADNSASKSNNQLPLSLLRHGILAQGGSVSEDELECILASLIYQNAIKGYIAHQRCVVLSKTDPFPRTKLSG